MDVGFGGFMLDMGGGYLYRDGLVCRGWAPNKSRLGRGMEPVEICLEKGYGVIYKLTLRYVSFPRSSINPILFPGL